MNEKRLYIAYGSNLNLPQMALRCPTAKPVGAAILKDHELLFRGGPLNGVATVAPKEGAAVPVLVWDIKPNDEIALDRYEGYPNLYGKQRMDVRLGGKTVSAMAYVMAPGHGAAQPANHYLNVIAGGYRSAGFDLGILDAALKRTEEIIAEEMKCQATESVDEQSQGQVCLFNLKWR